MFLTYSAIALASIPVILDALKNSPHAADVPTAPPSVGGTLFAWVVLLAFAYASPFLGGVRNVMGIIILGIGLYEAWKLTRAVTIRILGPFRVEPAPLEREEVAAETS